jgi:hypothetical protein
LNKNEEDGSPSQYVSHYEIGSNLNRIEKVAKREKLTPSTLFIAAFELALFSFTNQQIFGYSINTSTRNSVEIENSVGLFIEYNYKKAEINPSTNLLAHAKSVASRLTGDILDDTFPGSMLWVMDFKNQLDIKVNWPQIYYNYTEVSEEPNFAESIISKPVIDLAHLDDASVSLGVWWYKTKDSLCTIIQYPTDLYDRSTIQLIMNEYKRLLRGLINS